MAKKDVVIKVKSSGFKYAEKQAKKLAKAMYKTTSATKKMVKQFSTAEGAVNGMKSGMAATGKVMKGGFKKGMKIAGDGIKYVGKSIQSALGPLAIIFSAFTMLQEVLMKQQPVLDLVDMVFNTINATISILVESIGNMIEAMKSATNVWEFFAATQELTISGGYAAAASLQALTKAAEESAAKQAGLDAKSEAAMERQRQLRDDEFTSIENRKKANEKLFKLIEQDSKSKLKNAELQLKAAEALVKVEGTDENKNAMLERKGELQQIIADNIGKESEALSNRNALMREGLELEKEMRDAGTDMTLTALQHEIDMMDAGDKRDKKMRELLVRKNKLLLDSIEMELSNAKKGSDQYNLLILQQVKAEMLAKNELTLFDKSIADTKKAEREAERKAKEAQFIKDRDYRIKTEDAELKAAIKRAKARQKETDDIKKHNEERLNSRFVGAVKIEEVDAFYEDKRKYRTETQRRERDQENISRIADAQNIAGQLNQIADSIASITNNRLAKEENALQAKADKEVELTGEVSEATLAQQAAFEKEKNKELERQFNIQKAFNIANAIMGTASAVIAASPNPVLMGLAAAVGAANLAVIASTEFEASGGSGGGGGGTTPATPSTPDTQTLFDTSGISDNTDTETISSGGPGAMQVYVSERDISRTQNKVTVIENRATLG